MISYLCLGIHVNNFYPDLSVNTTPAGIEKSQREGKLILKNSLILSVKYFLVYRATSISEYEQFGLCARWQASDHESTKLLLVKYDLYCHIF